MKSYRDKAARRFLLVGCVLATCAFLVGTQQAWADATINSVTVTPLCRQEPTSASVDGTPRTIFVVTANITIPSGEAVYWDSASNQYTQGTYIQLEGLPTGTIPMMPIGSDNYRCSFPGLNIHADNWSLPSSASLTVAARTMNTTASPPSLTNRVTSSAGSVVVTGVGRQVLIPVDATGQSDQFKPAKKAGGVTVTPADPANYGDGSASATYTFRVMYKDPEGLPPRPSVPLGATYDQLGGSIYGTTGVESDQYNTPRRIDDPWRFPGVPDPTIPVGSNAPSIRPYRSGVFIVFDDNNDGQISVEPNYWGWRSSGAAQALSRVGDAPRMMVIDTDLPSQTRFRTSYPTAADWRAGVIFKYTIRATDHSVAVGIPAFFNFGPAVDQFFLLPFATNPGQKYLNAGRTVGYAFDPRSRSFVSLPAGLRRYTFLCSNDICYDYIPVTPTGSNFGYYVGRSTGNPFTDMLSYYGSRGQLQAGHTNEWRYWVQPNLNAPNTDPQNPPRPVFFPPFEIQVDPQITVEQRQLTGDTPDLLIGIPTPVHAREIVDPTTGTVSAVERTLYAEDLNRVTPTRFTTKDRIQWRFYYTQSRGLPPTAVELILLKLTGGSFVPVAGSPFPCQTLASGLAGRDPIYEQFPDPSHVNPYYAQFGVSLDANATQLGPGIYRYYFRASDDRRVAEWPGDSGADTSLANGTFTNSRGQVVTGVSHVANTLRINSKPVLRSPKAQSTVDPKTGAISWKIEVTYADADGDPPSRPLLVFPPPAGSTAPELTLVMQKDPASSNFVAGVTYSVQSATDPTVGAFGGRRNYYFSFTDNWKTEQNPENGETVIHPTTAGQTLFLNSPPFLVGATLDRARGSLGMNYTFSVRYGDNEGDPPKVVGGVPQVRLLIDGTPTKYYLTTAETAPDYSKGVLYSVTVSGRDIGPGAHTFAISAVDQYDLAAANATGTGPTIDTPVLSEGSVTGTPSVASTPPAGSLLSDWVFRVRYQHDSGVAPTYVLVRILNPDGSLLREVPLTQDPPANPADTIRSPGLFYSNAAAPVRFGAPGLYQYYFEASDGESVRQLNAGTGPFQGPLVASPVLTPQPVEPATGVTSVPFRFRVVYTHAGGAPPAPDSVQLQIVSPSGTTRTIVMALEDAANRTTAELPGSGWPYVAEGVLLPETGTYRYLFSASDGATRVETPFMEGPTSVAVERPVLSDASVVVAPGDPTQVIYSVRYKQTQRLVPTIQLIRPNVAPVLLVHQVSSGTDLAQGVIFAVTLPRPDPPLPFYFLVRVPGLDPIRYPDTDLIGPNVPPVLTAPAEGTVTPKVGHTGTLFQFRVVCTDADATRDPEVTLNVGGKRLAMKRVSGDVATGAVFAAETTLPVGDLVHGFLANDGTDTAQLSAQGPKVLPETAIRASAIAGTVPLDGTTPIQVAGALEPVVPSAELMVTFTDPSGTAVSHTVVADANGRFSDTLVPYRPGTWRVRVDYAGTSSIGGGTTELAVQVDPKAITLGTGMHMIGIPVAPDGGLLSAVLTGGSYQVARWNGTQYDYGVAALGNVAPGLGFWVNVASPVQAVPAGTTVDHSQAYGVRVVPGWNQVANPFLAPVAWSRVTLETASGAMLLPEAMRAGQGMDYGWIYDPTTSQYVLVHASIGAAQRSVQAWQGVWYKSNVEGRLVFAPPGRSAVPDEKADRRREQRTETEWQLRLVASNGRQVDSHNYVGVTSQGRAGGASQVESPPPIGYYVDLYLAGNNGAHLAADFRAPGAGEQIWDLLVETNVPDRLITVSAPNLSEVPHHLEVLLEDVDAGGKRIYLRTAGGYTFNPGETLRRRLRLIVRPRSEGALQITDITVTPTRAGMAIGYVLSRDALVTVEVLSPAGKRLSLVADRQVATQGRSTVVWDGTRADGTRLSAGLYLVQVTASTEEGLSARQIKAVVVTR